MPILIHLMAAATIALDLGVLAALALATSRKGRAWLSSFSEGTFLIDSIFLLSAAAVVGTLLLEYVDNLIPCLLCWWQRIFMYPIAVISALARWRGRSADALAEYVLALSIPGALFALYQHFLQIAPQGALPAPCGASGDCAARSVFEFGFVTLPWMAFTVFAALIVLALIALFAKKKTA